MREGRRYPAFCGLFGSDAEPVSTATPSATDETPVARVLRVIDADTLSMERDGTTITVDLLGLVTPQGKHENEDMRCLAPEAERERLEREKAEKDAAPRPPAYRHGGEGRRPLRSTVV